jgi:hypothetical protein
LTLSHLDILSGREQELLDVLKERRDHNLGLEKLVVRSCRVHEDEDELKLRELVKEVKWDNVTVAESDSDDEGVVEGQELEFGGLEDDVDVCEKYHNYSLSS